MKFRDIENPGPCARADCDRTAPADYDLCDECEGYYDECAVCDEYVSNQDNHRHLHWSGYHHATAGCGSHYYDHRDERPCVHAVLDTIGESLAIALRDGLRGRHYLAYYSGSILGPSSLNFSVGGRWSDGNGGGGYRSKTAPPDADDPKTGALLVPFPVPGGADPGPVCHDLGRRLTSIAKEMSERDDDYADSAWMAGVQWLVSLWAADNCRAAEALTVEWIDEWLAEVTGFRVVRADEVAHA